MHILCIIVELVVVVSLILRLLLHLEKAYKFFEARLIVFDPYLAQCLISPGFKRLPEEDENDEHFGLG